MQSKLKKVAVITSMFCILSTEFVHAASYPAAYAVPKKVSDKAAGIAACAESQGGYKEKNGTIYGQWYTNYVKNGTNYTKSWWGTMFITWCAVKSGISEEIIPAHACCSAGINKFRQMNMYYAPGKITPRRGDIIYFKYSQAGIVISCDGTYVRFVEGNNVSEGAVSARSVKLTDTTIHGYARPNYKKVISHKKPTANISISTKNNPKDNVMWIQDALFNMGYEVCVNGNFGETTKTAVKSFQQKYKLAVDGIVGPATRNKMDSLLGSKTSSKDIVEIVEPAKNYNSSSTANATTNTSSKKTNNTQTSSQSSSSYAPSKAPSNFKVASGGSNKILVSWTKDTKVTGYQIYRATSAKGKFSQIRFISNNYTNNFYNTSLPKGKTYYYMIRSYKEVKGKWYFSPWSSVKKCQVK